MNFIGDEYNNNNRLYGMFTLLSLLCSCVCCCCWRVVVFLSKVVCVHKFKYLLEGRPFFVVSAVAVAVFVRGNSGDRLAVRLAECINIHYPIADDDVFVCCCYVRHYDDGGGDGGGFMFVFSRMGDDDPTFVLVVLLLFCVIPMAKMMSLLGFWRYNDRNDDDSW